MTARLHRLAVLVLSLLVLTLAAASAAFGQTAEPARTVWDGVYTAEQASRGEDAFNSLCITCHRAGFQGPTFMQRWREDKVASFYNFISTKMPISSPGSGTKQQYLDIVAWVLSTNRFPAGDREISTSDLPTVQIIGKDGPQQVPDGSLVWSVGCLKQDSSGVWMLTNATEPVRTRDAEKPSDNEMEAARSKALGTLSFRFLYIESLRPAAIEGRKIMGRGFLDREEKGDRLLATALLPLESSCGH